MSHGRNDDRKVVGMAETMSGVVVLRDAVKADAVVIPRIRAAAWRAGYPGLVEDAVLAQLDPVADTQGWLADWDTSAGQDPRPPALRPPRVHRRRDHPPVPARRLHPPGPRAPLQPEHRSRPRATGVNGAETAPASRKAATDTSVVDDRAPEA